MGFNCGPWIARCFQSIRDQKRAPDTVTLVDDASTDTWYSAAALSLCRDLGYTYLRNGRNLRAPRNMWMAIRLIEPDPDDVVFLIETDDFLPHGGVFSRIMEVYEDPSVWMTYGSHEFHPGNEDYNGASAYPEDVIASRSFRTSPVSRFGHPITFRQRAWSCIEKADLKRDNGDWFKGSCDYITVIPMLEFCAPSHFRYLSEVLYSYNVDRPDSDSRVNSGSEPEWPEVFSRPKKASAEQAA
jgi:glycosyltransferase involved in cell wall biosynthesis